MIDRLVAWAREADPDVTAEELADALWLAGFMNRLPRAPVEPELPPALEGRPPAPEPPEPQRLPRPPDHAGEHTPSTEVASYRLPPPGKMIDGEFGVITRSPAMPAIPDVLALCRALRPLRRKAPSRTERDLDEELTARRIAETGLWVPRTRPVLQRWMDLAVVVDASASMVVWDRMIAELHAMLRRLGAFRDVRVWRFDGDAEGACVLHGTLSPAGTGHDPREFVDPSGRRMVLVVSDCVGAAWADGTVAAALELMARAGPVAIAQVLPQRLWAGCGQELQPVRLRSGVPGEPNARYAVEPREPFADLSGAGLPVPVFELEPRWLAAWTGLVTGTGSWDNHMALFTGLRGDHEPLPEAAGTAVPPEVLVQRFRSSASTEAYRLAVCLAGAPLSLPVMRLVQGAMLPASRPSHLAEVFLSGLLVRSADDDEHGGRSPDEDQYDFRPGVRGELLADLSSPDALQVLAKVSDFVTRRLGSTLDFRALLTGTAPVPGLSELGRPFAEVAQEVLRRLGGRYADAAARLDRVISPEKPSGRNGRSQPAIMGGVPPRNPNFTGRRELLTRLRRLLTSNGARVALLPSASHGPGGVGKTQLAIEYVHAYAGDYDLIWWIRADDVTQIRASFVELGARMGLPRTRDAKRAVAAVLHALRAGTPYRKWLLVFDNFDKFDAPELRRQFVPEEAGHILITTRNRSWSILATSVEVDVFSRAESVELVRRRRPDITADEAGELADRLGDLPLALEQAAASIAETTMPVAEYLRLLEQQFGTQERGPGDNYPPSVAATWAVAFAALEKGAPAAARLLELLAFFGPAPISLQLLRDGSTADLPEPLAETLRSDVRLHAAAEQIARYALARLDLMRDRIEVHRLVQTVVHGRLPSGQHTRLRECVHEILAAVNPGHPDDRSTWPRHREIAPHVVPAAMIYANGSAVRTAVLDQLRFLYSTGDYEGSRALSKLAVIAWQRGFGANDEITLVATRNWANSLRALGEVETAWQLDQDTHDRFARIFGPDHEHTLASANSVGADLRAMGRFAEARQLDEANLARHRRKWGDLHPLTLRTANNLAVDLRQLGDPMAAFELDQGTVRRREDLDGPDDPATLWVTSNLIRDLLGLGLYAEALRHQERVLPVHREVLGGNNTQVLLAMRNVVIALRKTGDFTRALSLAEENFHATCRRLGDDHEHTLAAMMSYCNALRCAGSIAEALRIGREAYGRYRAHYFGERHPFTLACAVNLAIVLRHNGDVAEARELNARTLEDLDTVLGRDHPTSLCCATNLGNDLAALGTPNTWLDFDTLLRSRRTRGDHHPDTLMCAVNAGEVEEGVRELGLRLGVWHPDVVAAAAGRRLDCDVEPAPS
ncbi:hypothetical protein Lesp02_21060 [Lentzea sp. NBRC 105346]|uniref:FxSxx-COOH system tetratricopeptide repeat protein n=1 Tax=Lentzea sp. NBRC 105346 TaxID=3032205 RepID=UPI0024A1FFF5|nr:FxSxx-COOH system tetratricopeptide repeat protein [Lentzea sp. NBRC 105346]GLZ29916.1 hypothetical protein Lesp02_21060 [Lentzea sp. NBRC 105346]